MKNKILTVSFLLSAFVFTGSVFAANQGSGTGSPAGMNSGQAADSSTTEMQAQITTQTANQGKNSQIQKQTNAQTQTGNGTQTQQKMQDGNGSGNQVQSQGQIQNQGEEKQIQTNENQGSKNQNSAGNTNATQRKSQVANTVQQMLQLAERNGGIGEKVRTIAQTQTQNQEKIEANLEKIQGRSGFAKFFIGPNYGEINNAKRTLEQSKEQIKQLDEIRNQLSNQGDQQILTEQIQTLEQANSQIETSLEESQKGFSLLGWMFKWFAK
jgi:chromosome segregation ATPase